MKWDADLLKEIFAQAQQIESDKQRERYLTDACRGDAELRRQIDSLLMAEKEAGDFLAQTIPLPSADFEPEPIGSVIGRYKLLEKIGEGGFGVVYMAEQQEPVQRKVALKIIKPGMDTRQVIARFEAERQALALMDHPNIAKVLDAGATEAKRPYFVMELVRGIPITDYCDQAKLSTGERLQLFIKVCQAVQHAHQKAVIHRDLKPSNILVTLHDGQPVPKVIDFGVAKALGQKLTDKTLFTAFRQMIGTPAYMAPEQAEMSGLDIDTRSDIYSLGVLLYELLTGVTPFDKETLARAAIDEIRRIIRETEPPKPSTRLRTLGDQLTEVARHRQTVPAVLSRLLRGDLDWIVMKCLEKDRNRRYETATALGSDIERHLNCEPVAARPPTVSYRALRLIRRHRLAFVAGSSVLAALLVGLAVSGILLINERRQRIRAEAAEKDALAAALESAHLASALRRASGGDVDATNYVAALTRASAGWTRERIRRELNDRPELQAGLLHFLAMRLWTLEEDARSVLETSEKGDSSESINLQRSMLLEALTLHRQVYGSNHPIVADVLCDLASEFELAGGDREHEKYAHASLDIRKQLMGSNSLEVADSLVALANAIADDTNRYVEAQGHYLEALSIRTNRLPQETRDVCSLYRSLAACQERNGHLAAAEQSLRHAVINDGRHDESMLWFPARWSLISLLCKRGALPEAEDRCREILKMAREVPVLAPLVTSVQNKLGWILLDEGKLDEAEGLARDVLGSIQRTAPGGWRHLSIAQLLLGAVLLEQKRYSDAEPLLLSGYEGMKQHADELPNDSPWLEKALQRLTQLYKRWDEAVPDSGKSAQTELWAKRLEAFKRTEAGTKSNSN